MIVCWFNKNIMRKEICFEGVCTSGKTTLGRLMEDRNTRYFPEYSQIDTGVIRRNKMKFPHQTQGLAETSFRSFLALDTHRNQIIAATGAGLVVTDRGLVGLVAFEYSLARNNFINVFDVSAELIESYTKDPACGLPVAWVYTRFSNLDVFEERVAGKTSGLPYILQRDTALLLQEYYDEFFMNVGERVEIVVAEGDLMSNKQRVSQFIGMRFGCYQITNDELIGIIRRTNDKLQRK